MTSRAAFRAIAAPATLCTVASSAISSIPRSQSRRVTDASSIGNLSKGTATGTSALGQLARCVYRLVWTGSGQIPWGRTLFPSLASVRYAASESSISQHGEQRFELTRAASPICGVQHYEEDRPFNCARADRQHLSASLRRPLQQSILPKAGALRGADIVRRQPDRHRARRMVQPASLAQP
jgi:hypothetical protein